MSRKTSNVTAITENAQDIGYVLGKMEMLEKQMIEQNEEIRLVLDKLEQISHTLTFWRHSLWILKALAMTLPLIVYGRWESIVDLWKEF